MTLLHSTAGTQAHVVLEALAYFIGARIYWFQARGVAQPPSLLDRWLLLGFVVAFAGLGSKALHVLEHLPYLLANAQPGDWLGGKSVLGGFMGGTLGAELGKRVIGWKASTGDAWLPALAVGLVIGRMGCQLSGVWDQTYGVATSLPWGWDYGDGVLRHPVALYEALLVALSAGAVWVLGPARQGARFALFMLLYCFIRLSLDWLKPPFGPTADGSLPAALYHGLSAIQWAAVAGMAGYLYLLRVRLRRAP